MNPSKSEELCWINMSTVQEEGCFPQGSYQEAKTSNSSGNQGEGIDKGNPSSVRILPSYQNRGRGIRPHSTPATLLWLEENYEMAEGVCIPRNTLYQHYVDFCTRQYLHPVNAASFGKIIRQQFPGLTTRRLGTRGQSRYHYYGIAIREGSKYFEVHYSKRGNSSCPDKKKETYRQLSFLQCRGKTTSLPDFPSVRDMHLPSNVSREKVMTFLMMYRTHCQRILDSVSRSEFDEIQSFIHHFYREIPLHIVPSLESNCLVNLIGVCDSILYKSICKIVMPSVIQAVPDRLTQIVRNFAHNYDSWLQQSLSHLPQNLRNLKALLGERFTRMLRRQSSLNHLCQAAKMVLHSPELTLQMVRDWRQLDLENVSQQTLYNAVKHCESGISSQLIRSLYREFEQLLEDNSSLESFCAWLEGLVDRCVLGESRRSKNSFHKVAHSFLTTWTSFGNYIIRNMTLHSLSSFGSFHLLHLTFDDFITCLVEGLYSDERASEFLNQVSTNVLPEVLSHCLETEIDDVDESTSVIPLLTSLDSAISLSTTTPSTFGSLITSTVSQVPLVTSSTTPGLQDNHSPSIVIEMNHPSQTNVNNMELPLTPVDHFVEYVASTSTSDSPGSVGTSVSSTSIALGGNPCENFPSDASNYCYDYDHRSGYRMTSMGGRNYIYATSAPFNQYFGGGPAISSYREDRSAAGLCMESFASTQKPLDHPAVLGYCDPSVSCSSTYHYGYQPFDSSYSHQKCKQK